MVSYPRKGVIVMSFFIALMLTIFVVMYAEKNFPGAIGDLFFGIIKLLFGAFILILLLILISNFL
jgi:hypothetical protein